MGLVTRYSALQKRDPGPSGDFRVFSVLRAVGLAVEVGQKEAERKGPLAVQATDLLQVSVKGNLKVQQKGKWAVARSAFLSLRLRDAELAKVVLQKQLSFLSSLYLNVWRVDKQRGVGRMAVVVGAAPVR